jgi:hypothetical protein
MFHKLIIQFLFLIISIPIASCTSKNISYNKYKIIGLKVIMSTPILEGPNKIQYLIDSHFVFNYGNLVIYKIPYTHTNNIIQIDSSGNVIGQKSIPINLYKYFLYNKNDLEGFQYDSINTNAGIKISVDSFLDKYSVSSFLLRDDFLDRNTLTDSIVSSFGEKKVYATKNKANRFSNDSMELYFSNSIINRTSFSLMPKTKDPNFNKLYKLVYIYNATLKETHSIELPKRYLTISFDSVIVNKHHEINYLIQKRAITFSE